MRFNLVEWSAKSNVRRKAGSLLSGLDVVIEQGAPLWSSASTIAWCVNNDQSPGFLACTIEVQGFRMTLKICHDDNGRLEA